MELERLCIIFPEEVWEMIFKHVSTSRNMYNAIIAFPHLLQRFHVQRPLLLFPEALPLFSEYLGIQGVLSCRLVCKHWDQALHNAVSNHSCHQPYNEDLDNGLPINTVEVNQNCPMFKLATSHPVLHFRTAHSMEDFMEMTRNSQFPRDPVFGNTIYFDTIESRNDSRPEFQQISHLILTEFGQKVKHLILTSDKNFETAQEFYSRIYKHLQLTPNLKSLSLQFENQDEGRNLSVITNLKPLPMLPFLQSLHIKTGTLHGVCMGNMVQTVMSFAGSNVSNVRKLKLEFREYREYVPIPGRGHGSKDISAWDHLTCCFLQKLTDLELRSNENILRHETFKECNLQKLVIHAHTHSVLSVDARVLADCMNGNYGKNLRVLNLHNCGCDTTTVSRMGSARIKKLHTLRIRNFHQLNFQFLLNLPALVKLEVAGSKQDSSEVRHGAQFRSLNRMSTVGVLIYNGIYNRANTAKSEIWQLLPTLQKLKIPKQQGENFILTSFVRPRVQ